MECWLQPHSNPKLIIQELWKRKLDWDEELPPDLKHRWNDWKATLHELTSIEIPRWYGFNFPEESALELHVFADTSSCAYGAVAYLRFQSNSELKCSFVIGKSRTAPIKENSLSIPKLELPAAVTASRIQVKIMEELKETVTSVFLWSDSKTVLNYLHNDYSNFGVYVTHGVNEILNSTNIEDWQYVPTKSNAADDATRYISFHDLNSNSRWFKGPDFIYKDSVTKTKYVNCNLEEYSNANVNLNKIDNEVLISTFVKPVMNWSYYSSINKIVRHLAWILELNGN